MRFVILHYHIFKNAGSTIEDILDHSFGERFGTLETPAGGGLISHPDLMQYLHTRPALSAFSSHQIRYPLPQAPGFLFFDICFLRDPIDRLRSIYDYFLQRPNPGDPMSALANRCSAGDFVAGMIEHHSLFVRNNQVNLLACAGDSDEPDERDLAVAIRRMKAASFLGVVDCFGQSVVAGAEALRAAFPELDCARPAVNVSKGMVGTVESRIAGLREACRPDVFEELERITALDRRLVELARAEVLRRFAHCHVGQGFGPAAGLPPGRAQHQPSQISQDGRVVARRFISLASFWRELAGSGREILFDADYYRGSLLHFLVNGDRSPHPLFDSAFYLRKYPDVAAAGVNPLCHYLKYGTAELRQPHPLFDPVFYLEHNPDVRRAGLNPLLHYVRNGAAEDRKPHPLFEPAYYRANCREALAPGQNPLVHFLARGAAAASPHPLFDCAAYVAAHPEVAEKDMNPLVHYVESVAAFSDPTGIQVEIQDVRLIVNYRQDADGAIHWIAEPQQLPFLRAVSMDQIRAQISR